jgi:hypothetical protein
MIKIWYAATFYKNRPNHKKTTILACHASFPSSDDYNLQTQTMTSYEATNLYEKSQANISMPPLWSLLGKYQMSKVQNHICSKMTERLFPIAAVAC